MSVPPQEPRYPCPEVKSAVSLVLGQFEYLTLENHSTDNFFWNPQFLIRRKFLLIFRKCISSVLTMIHHSNFSKMTWMGAPIWNIHYIITILRFLIYFDAQFFWRIKTITLEYIQLLHSLIHIFNIFLSPLIIPNYQQWFF